MILYMNALRRKNLQQYGIYAALLPLFLLMIVWPQRYAAACAAGVALWAKTVLPTLFPFFVLTALLTKLGAAERLGARLAPLTGKCGLPGCAAYVFLLSILSGYPVGSRAIADLSRAGALTPQEATRTSALCSTSGPMFLLGSVGGVMFRDPLAGAILLASHLLAVLLVCLVCVPFLRTPTSSQSIPVARPDTDNALYLSVHGSVLSILCVGGFIAVFCVLLQAFDDLHLLRPLQTAITYILTPLGAETAAEPFTFGLFEATRGCMGLAQSQTLLALPLCAFIVTFGGACILAQQLGYLKQAGVRSMPFIAIKTVQAFAAFWICLGLCAACGRL